MAKGNLENMLGELIGEFMVQESAKAVLDNAKAKVELEVNCDGETAAAISMRHMSCFQK